MDLLLVGVGLRTEHAAVPHTRAVKGERGGFLESLGYC
jgi:hypothetical protein